MTQLREPQQAAAGAAGAAPPSDVALGAPGATSSSLWSSALGTQLERFGLLVILILAIVVFSLLSPDTFPTTANLQAILGSNAVLGILAIGAVVPFVAGRFDLSLAATVGLSAMVSAQLMSAHGWSLVLAALVAVGVGGLIGLINGVVVARLRVNAIIATLGSASVVSGLVLWTSGGNTVSTNLPDPLLRFGSGMWLGVPRPFVLLVVVALVVGYVLRQTPFGRSLYALGDNEKAATLVGLNTTRLTVGAFVLGGAVAGLGGLLQVAVSGSAAPDFGPNLLLPALTAVFLGATTIRPGEYNILGTLIAIAFVAASLSGLTLVGVADWVEPVYEGATLILAVSVSAIIRKHRTGS